MHATPFTTTQAGRRCLKAATRLAGYGWSTGRDFGRSWRLGGEVHRSRRWLDADLVLPALLGHSWSAVKLDLYGLKFYYQHVLKQPWIAPGLIKPPKTQRLPDIVTVEEARRLFAATRVVSYRVFYFTLYSLGLRLGWAKACDFRSATSMPRASACISATPKATGMLRAPAARHPMPCCAASGPPIATPYCCSPIATAA